MNGRLLLLGLFTILCTAGTAQQFGGFPPSTRWRQIQTDTLQLIFERPIDSQARSLAAIIHEAARRNPNPLGNKVRRISTVLHKRTTLANGYVALGPFRSEYFLIPGSNLFEFGATPWDQTLAVHEYRHVHQYANFNKGISRIAAWLFGQEGQALFNAVSIPDWFFEGDAVHTETITTAQGRGRAPYFFNGFKALWHEGRNYSWIKLRNGSLKDFVPNHYPLGYLLVNYGYQQYGADFWQRVTDRALTFRGTLGFFGTNLRRISGRPFAQFRNDALAAYQHEVSTRRDAVKKRETVTDYLFAQPVGDDSTLYVKSSYRHLPAFFIRDRNGEHRLKLRHITTEDWVSHRNGTLAYTAYSTSPRWSLVNYSDIILLDLASRKEKRLTRKARYFTPDISADGSLVMAVAFTDSLTSELHFLRPDGTVASRIAAPTGGLFVHPRFLNNDEFVVAMRYANSTMGLLAGSVSKGSLETLLPPTLAAVGYPYPSNGQLYFVSSQSGNDDIYALDLTEKRPVQTVRQLTFGQTGGYFPAAVGDSLLWSQFTSNGFRLSGLNLRHVRAAAISGADLQKRGSPFSIALAASPNVLLQEGGRFETKDYKKGTGLFNFHSWRPAFTDPEISYSLYSDNILSTFSNELFYRYNINETSHGVGFNTFFGGWFPVLNAGIDYTFNRTIRTTRLTYSLNQLEARVGYRIPLNFTQGKTLKFLTFGSNYVYNQLQPTQAFRDRLRGRTDSYLHHFLTYTQQLPRAVQHIFPKFGYLLNGQYRHLLGQNGFQSVGGFTLFLPSIRNHSLVLAGSGQETDTANITFSNRFANARGYNDFYFSRMWRLSANYHMPLLYPDLGLNGVIYFLRIRSNLFYDYGRVYSNDKSRFANQRSTGAELFFDTKLFNTLPATFGLRLTRLLDNDFSGTRPKGSHVFEVVVPLDLIPQ